MVTAAKIVPFPLSPLTARELEILRLIKTGYSNQEIGQQLFLSPETGAFRNGGECQAASQRRSKSLLRMAERITAMR